MPEDDSTPEQGEISQADTDLLETSKKRFDLCVEAERPQRELALADLKFRKGGDEQWNAAVLAKRKAENKPCLTIDTLPAREAFILNDQRQNRPSVQISPVDDQADQDTAEILQGIFRHIEYDSHADVAYDTVTAAIVRTGGPAYIRLVTEFESPTSFKQVIKIKRIRNQFQVYMDPNSQQPDGSDANYAFIFDTLTKDDYKAQYPKSTLASLDDWNSVGDRDPDWLSNDGIRLVEYLYREMVPDVKCEVRNKVGTVREILKSQLPKKLPKGIKILREAPTEVPVVKWCKHNATEILETTDWPGQWLGLVRFIGNELDVDGDVTYEGMVRHVKDVARTQNALVSAEVEAIAIAKAAPYVAAAGQTEKYPEWKTLSTTNHNVVRYDPVGVSGSLAPPPKRDIAEPAIQAITNARLTMAELFRDITGIYEAQYGAKSREVSGRAIDAKKQQGEISNYHYQDNVNQGLRFVGIQGIDLIQKVMTEPQVARIIGEDGTQKVQQINQIVGEGQPRKNDVTIGRYDVTVSTTTWQSKRQKSAESMLQLVSAHPEMMQIAGDLVVGELDFAGAKQLAERYRKTLPPGLADDDGTDPKVKLQQTQAQLQKMSEITQQLTQQLNDAKTIINEKQVEQQGKMDVTELQERTKILIAEINTKFQESKLRMEMENEQWQTLHGSAHEAGMDAEKGAREQQAQASDQQHQVGMADKQAEIAAQQSDQGHQQTLEQQQQAAELAPETPAS